MQVVLLLSVLISASLAELTLDTYNCNLDSQITYTFTSPKFISNWDFGTCQKATHADKINLVNTGGNSYKFTTTDASCMVPITGGGHEAQLTVYYSPSASVSVITGRAVQQLKCSVQREVGISYTFKDVSLSETDATTAQDPFSATFKLKRYDSSYTTEQTSTTVTSGAILYFEIDGNADAANYKHYVKNCTVTGNGWVYTLFNFYHTYSNGIEPNVQSDLTCTETGLSTTVTHHTTDSSRNNEKTWRFQYMAFTVTDDVDDLLLQCNVVLCEKEFDGTCLDDTDTAFNSSCSYLTTSD